MTKTQEIENWRKFSATMPAASTYSGAWIAEQIPFLEIEFRNDTPPGERARTMSDCREEWNRSREDAKKTDADAKAHAERIRAQATTEADAIRAQAREHAARIMSQPRHALRQALDKLD